MKATRGGLWTATLDPVVHGGTGHSLAYRSSCRAVPANLSLGARKGPVLPMVVGARSSVPAGSIPLHTPGTLDDACQGVTFTIHLHGTAARESGK